MLHERFVFNGCLDVLVQCRKPCPLGSVQWHVFRGKVRDKKGDKKVGKWGCVEVGGKKRRVKVSGSKTYVRTFRARAYTAVVPEYDIRTTIRVLIFRHVMYARA